MSNAPLAHHALGRVDSTNLAALRLLEAGEGHEGTAALPFLLTAQEQRQGRGRGGNAWASPPGNFYGTFAIAATKPDGKMAQVSFLAAVALAHVLEGWGLRPRLKWPNDILIQGAKVSGILLEKHGEVLLIGMGVNLTTHPAVPGYASTSLADEGLAIKPEALAKPLAEAFARWLQRWHDEGFGPVRAAWLARAHGLGQSIGVRLMGQPAREGRFAGLDNDGALLLDGVNGLETYHAGEVYFHAAGH